MVFWRGRIDVAESGRRIEVLAPVLLPERGLGGETATVAVRKTGLEAMVQGPESRMDWLRGCSWAR